MIQITDKIRITRLDEKNLQLEEYRKVINKKSKEERFEWCWKGYYGDLKSAINGVLKYYLMELSTEDIKTLSELVERIDNIDKELKNGLLQQNGKWVYSEMGCVINCSNCGERLELCYPDGTEIRATKYCPNCGAKMGAENEN